jgi:glycosyltransferase involved in cell wall biosynthesis
MRICFVYDALFPYVSGGAERRNYEFARRLAERHDVHVVTWQYWSGPATIKQDGVTLHGVGRPAPLYGADGKRTLREAVAFALRVLPVLIRQRFDVIDWAAIPFVPLPAVWIAARVTRARLVVTWHELWGAHWLEYLPHRPVVARLARLLEKTTTRVGSRLVAVSPFTAQRLVEAGVAAERIVVLPNGVDVRRFATGPARRRTWDIVFVGRLIDEKRVDLLLHALAMVKRTRPRVRCAVVGDGPERQRLQALAAELGVVGNVRFTGRVDDAEVTDYLRSAKVFTLPSEREGFGIVAIEAQAAGCVPVVVRGPHSAAATLIDDGVNGVGCAPTADALATAVVSLLTGPKRRARLQANGLVAAREYDWDRLAERAADAYARLPGGLPQQVAGGAVSWR